MWPTCEQGTISSVPPHIHVLKLSSRFSAPQMSNLTIIICIILIIIISVVSPVIVSAEPLEEHSVDAEQSPGHGGRGHGLRRVRVLLLLVVGDGVPVELQKNISNTVKIFTPN